MLKLRAQSWPISNIKKVVDFKRSFELGAMFWNILIALIGLPIVLSFNKWSILGLKMVALGVFNVKDIFKPKYLVTVEFFGDEDQNFEWSNENHAIEFRDAIHRAV